jgi:hypothetical protein
MEVDEILFRISRIFFISQNFVSCNIKNLAEFSEILSRTDPDGFSSWLDLSTGIGDQNRIQIYSSTMNLLFHINAAYKGTVAGFRTADSMQGFHASNFFYFLRNCLQISSKFQCFDLAKFLFHFRCRNVEVAIGLSFSI